MSDTTENENTNDNSDNGGNWRRDLEKRLADAEAKAKTLEEEKATTARATAFKDAGLDLENNKLHQLAAKAYEGDVTTDAIKAFAIDAGLLKQDTSTQETANQHASMDFASQNAAPPAVAGSQQDVLEKLSQATDKNAFFAALAQNGMLAKR